MLVLRGAPALSDFRLRKLRRADRRHRRTVTLYAEFLPLRRAGADLDAAELAVLERLLRYGPRLAGAGRGRTLDPGGPAAGDHLALVVQGHGHRPQLRAHRMRRLERGTAYCLDTGGRAITAQDLERAAAALHDRMTQAVLFDQEEAHGCSITPTRAP